MRISRRQALAGLLGGTAATFAGFETRSSGLLAPKTAAHATGKTIDAFEILQRAIRSRTRLTWGGTPALANSTAPQEISVITIKVMNQICPPLVFRLGQIQSGTDTTVGPTPFDSTVNGSQGASGVRRLADALTFLRAAGIEEVAPAALGGGRYRALRFNRWFATMLDTGKADGTAFTYPGIDASEIGPFPANVAIQPILGVNQSVTASNHDFNNCGITGSSNPTQGGDLAFHVSELGSKLVSSPLGVVCFNMGSVTETDGGNLPNRVLASDLAQTVVGARSVGDYVSTLKQATALGLTSLIDDDLVQQFDQIAKPPTNFPGELKARRQQLLDLFDRLTAASTLETTKATISGVANVDRGALQDSPGKANDDARMEFIAQCKFVRAALDLDGKPFRNFSLYCHLSDIDGASFDKTVADATATQALSYVEGMRQLAIGLNILAGAISKHQNVYVVVVSEGGRDFTGSDNDVGFAMVLGPSGGAGDLVDHLYAPLAYDGASNAFVTDPGSNTVDFRLAGGNGRLTSGGLINQPEGVTGEDGLSMGPNVVTNNEILIGVIRHIESTKGMAQTTTKGLGRFLKLKTS